MATETLGTGSYPYSVVRRPTKRNLRDLGRQSDVILQSNISLKTLLPLLYLRKPIVITHHTWLTRMDGRIGWQDRLKRSLLPLCHNVAISRAISESLPVRSIVLANPFEMGEFFPFRDASKPKDIAFMGRLVSDKGCDLLLQALAILQDDGLYPSLTIIGDGPERKSLEATTVTLGLTKQVHFLGSLTEQRGRELAQHKILAIPSRWSEPFGLVALEGIAAGCAIVASSQGGLSEAVGPCGLLHPNGDVFAIAASLKKLLGDESCRAKLVAESEVHLEKFLPGNAAQHYLDFFKEIMKKHE